MKRPAGHAVRAFLYGTESRANKNATLMSGVFVYLERETRLELATPTLARSCSTN
jgi:hypothetical protein